MDSKLPATMSSGPRWPYFPTGTRVSKPSEPSSEYGIPAEFLATTKRVGFTLIVHHDQQLINCNLAVPDVESDGWQQVIGVVAGV